MIVISTYLIYLVISIALTIWVAETLRRKGRVFVIAAFNGDEVIADSVNHLLVVGFYLINVGFVSLFLSLGDHPADVTAAFEWVSWKVGVVLVVLGGMHFFNVFNFAKMRRKAQIKLAVRGAAPA
jgi:cytochrome c biogenesis protein CcdA